jgi:hypothetical protein
VLPPLPPPPLPPNKKEEPYFIGELLAFSLNVYS